MTMFPTTWPHDVLTLGIDVGGTGLKAAVVNSQGVMVGARVKVPTPYPCPPTLLPAWPCPDRPRALTVHPEPDRRSFVARDLIA